MCNVGDEFIDENGITMVVTVVTETTQEDGSTITVVTSEPKES